MVNAAVTPTPAPSPTTAPKPTAPKPTATPGTAPATGVPAAPAQSDASKAYMEKLIGQILKVCPEAPKAKLAKYAPSILKALAGAGLVSKNQLIAFIATCYVECDSFQTLREYASGSDYEGRKDLGNIQPGDGTRFRGRGFIQITGRSNYKLVGLALKIDLISNPNKLETDVDLCSSASVWWWKGGTGNNPSKPAEKGNWLAVRKAVNGGVEGLAKFMSAVDRGVKIFTEDLKPDLIGAAPLSGNYGLVSCADPGSGATRTVTGSGTTQADMLSQALGLHMLDRQKAITFHAVLEPSAYPETLQLKPQKTFEGTGYGEGLDGTLTVEQVNIYCGKSLELELWAHQPDPNAPAPLVFKGDATAPLNQNAGVAATSVAAGSIEGALAVPYFSQRDNKENPDGTCNSSSCAMAAKFLGAKISGDDEYNVIRGKYGASTDHGAQNGALASLGIKSTWSTNLNYKDLDASLARKKPIVIGILHRGPLSAPNPQKGHICVVIGRTKDGNGYIMNDPYGSVMDGYATNQGAGVIYPKNVLDKRWLVSGAGSGWGRIFS